MTQDSDSDFNFEVTMGRFKVSDSIMAKWRATPAPEHTTGNCVRWDHCKQFDADLGNGYCVKCWDKGYG